MSDKCESESTLIKFFKGYERIIILIYALLSFILNIIIIVSIYLAKNKKISNIIKITGSILIVNFINIFAYTFEWVTCKEKKENENLNEKDEIKIIELLIGNSESNGICQLQSLLILLSSVSQDYLMILFFYLVNRRKEIEPMIINLLILLCIIFPLLISLIYLKLDAFGVNGDFCYLKKFEKIENKLDYYKDYDQLFIYFIITYGLRTINFSITIYFLINISKYIIKEKNSFKFIFQKLSIFFIQLFKLFVIIVYRITTFIIGKESETVGKVYNILSTVDGVLMPLAYILINDIFCSFCNTNKRRKLTIDESEEDLTPNSPITPQKKVEETLISNSVNKGGNFVGTNLFMNSNNFDLSYD